MPFSFDLLLEAVVFGILLGCFYAAVSIGLSVSFGLLDVPHVAHPAILVFGSYCTFVLAGLGLDPIVAGIVLMPPFFMLGMAVYRRFIVRPHQIDPTPRFVWALTLLLVINVTGFIMEACRLAATQPWWAPWSPVGYALGQGMLALGMTDGALRATHLGVWLFHAVISLLFVATLPYSYFVHLVLTPLNIFFAKLGPRGAIAPILDLEAAAEKGALGISKLEEFSWKRRLDFDRDLDHPVIKLARVRAPS